MVNQCLTDSLPRPPPQSCPSYFSASSRLEPCLPAARPGHGCSTPLLQRHTGPGTWHSVRLERPTVARCRIDYTGGSSFMRDGHRYVGVVVVSETEIIWAEPLPAGTSAQWAELTALTQALTLGKGRELNVFTDS